MSRAASLIALVLLLALGTGAGPAAEPAGSWVGTYTLGLSLIHI